MNFDHLEYDPETGIIWDTRRNREAGCLQKSDGYRKIKVQGKCYYGGPLAWYLYWGEWPNGEIDHINRVRDDNRLCNLRVVDRSKQMLNRNAMGKIKIKGVYKSRNKYRVMKWCPLDKKMKSIASFNTIEEAQAKSEELFDA